MTAPKTPSVSTLTPLKPGDPMPKRFIAEWHLPDGEPESDILDWDTPREAWNDIITRLEDYEHMYEPHDPDDQSKPLVRSRFAWFLDMMSEKNAPGSIWGPDGYVYSVTDTYDMICLVCQRTFPNVYEPGVCPFEAEHGAEEPPEYKVGDPDPTPVPAGDCPAKHRGKNGNVFSCTWYEGHDDRPHVAGTGKHIVEVWS